MNKFFVDKKFKFRAILSLGVIALLCFSILLFNGIFSSKRVSNVLAGNDAVKAIDEAIESNYWVDAEVNWPTSIEIPNGSNTITATNGVVIMPNGTTVPVGELTLNQIGNYSVRYYYQSGNVTKFAEKTVFVGNKLASLETENGSITPVTAKEQQGKVLENNASDVTLQGDDALIVRLKEGNSFMYNKSIDLSNVDENGLCSLISLDFHMRDVERQETNYKVTKETARKLIVRVSDSYNPLIYIDMVYSTIDNQGNVREIGLLNAKANDQAKYSGAFNWQESFQQYIGVYEWIKYYKHKSGTEHAIYNATTSTLGPNSNWMNDFTHSALTWKYDPVNQLVYANFGATKAGTTDLFITDLSFKDLYGNRAFAGFPSNKVTVSILTDEWITADSARVDIFALGDCSGEELVEEYKNGYHVDDVAVPVFDLGIERTNGEKVYVPYGADFTIPTPKSVVGMAKGTDYKVNVYLNYGDDAEYEVPVVDGKVKINKATVYTVKYSARGTNGGEGVEILTLVADKNVSEAIKLNIDETFFAKSFESGQIITLPAFTVDTINKEDSIKVKIKAVHEKTEIDVDNNTLKFILPYSGAYKIVYEISDNLYTVEKEFTINVSGSNNYGFLDNIVIPKYFIKGTNYSLPNITGYLLSGGDPIAKQTKVFVKFDDGEWEEVNRAKVNITGSNTMAVKYVCGNVEQEATLVAKIVDVNYAEKNKLKFKEYFIHDNFTVAEYDKDDPALKGNTELKYTLTDVNAESKTLKFINPVDYTELDFRFKVNTNPNYSKVNVTLIDYYDSTNKYVLSVENVKGTAYVSYNGGENMITESPYVSTKVKSISYNYVSGVLQFENVKQTVDLREYFASSLCYLEVDIDGVTGESDFVVDAINGQNMRNSSNKDSGNPRISTEDFTGNFELGTEINLSIPCITDVLSTVLDEKVTLTVSYVEGDSFVSDINGVQLLNVEGLKTYTFKLDKVGEYKVEYTFYDGANKRVMKPYSVFVFDRVSPTITFDNKTLDKDATEIKIKKGTTIDASFSATDDLTAQDNITTALWVQDLNSYVNYTVHNEKNLIHFNYASRFEVYAYAEDATGNYTFKTFIVVVE